MSQIDFQSRFTNMMAAFTAPAAPASNAPALAGTPEAAPLADQNHVQAQAPQAPEMGALPWDPAIDAPKEPAIAHEIPITENPKFLELSEKDRATVMTLLETASAGLEPGEAKDLSVRLSRMLDSGALTDIDTFKKSTLHYLADFNKESIHSSLKKHASKGELARDLITALSEPGKLMQGDSASSCAEATLEATLAFTQPADYARIAVGLATKGAAPIPGTPNDQQSNFFGGPPQDFLQLDANVQPKGRSALSSIMQQSFNAKVSSREEVPFYLANLDIDTGLDANQVAMLYDGIIGKNHLTLYAERGVDMTPAIKFALENAPDSVVKVTMQSDAGLHGVAITGVSEKGVDIWDPALGEIVTMPADEFNQLVVRATLDSGAFLQKSEDKEIRTLQSQFQRQQWSNENEFANSSGSDRGKAPEKGGRLGSRGRKG